MADWSKGVESWKGVTRSNKPCSGRHQAKKLARTQERRQGKAAVKEGTQDVNRFKS